MERKLKEDLWVTIEKKSTEVLKEYDNDDDKWAWVCLSVWSLREPECACVRLEPRRACVRLESLGVPYKDRQWWKDNTLGQ